MKSEATSSICPGLLAQIEKQAIPDSLSRTGRDRGAKEEKRAA